MTSPLCARMQLAHPTWVLGCFPHLALPPTKGHYCPSYTLTNELVKKSGTNNNLHLLLVDFPRRYQDPTPRLTRSPTNGSTPPRLQVPAPLIGTLPLIVPDPRPQSSPSPRVPSRCVKTETPTITCATTSTRSSTSSCPTPTKLGLKSPKSPPPS